MRMKRDSGGFFRGKGSPFEQLKVVMAVVPSLSLFGWVTSLAYIACSYEELKNASLMGEVLYRWSAHHDFSTMVINQY